MTISVIQASEAASMDDLNTRIGTGHNLVFYSATNVEVATCPFTGAGVRSASGGKEIITLAAANYADDTTSSTTAISYAQIEQGATVVVKFTDPATEIGLVDNTGTLTQITTDIVLSSPAYLV